MPDSETNKEFFQRRQQEINRREVERSAEVLVDQNTRIDNLEREGIAWEDEDG